MDLSDAGLNKELNDVLEREKDLIEQLRFTEDDLRRTRSQMKVWVAANLHLIIPF